MVPELPTSSPAQRTRMVFGLIAAIYAVYLFLVLADSLCEYLTDTSPTAEPAWQFIYYFTNQSNTLILIWLVIFAVANLGTGRLAARAARLVTRGIAVGLTLYMLVVFIVVSCILNPFYTGAFEPVPTGAGLFVHVASPILTLTLYLLYPWAGRATWRTVLAWMGYLFFYVALANIVGATTFWRDGTRAYPYDFLNPHTYPNVGVYALAILGLALACFALGCGLLRLKDRFDASFRTDAVAPKQVRYSGHSDAKIAMGEGTDGRRFDAVRPGSNEPALQLVHRRGLEPRTR